MENASKALLMTASILVGIIILSLGVYLVNSFRNFSQTYRDNIETQKIKQFNAQFTAISGRNNISIHEIITLRNFAKEFNDINSLDSTDSQYIHIIIDFGKRKEFDLSDKTSYPKTGNIKYENQDEFINELLDGTYIYKLYGNGRELEPFENSESGENRGQFQYEYNKEDKSKIYYNCYESSINNYSINPTSGRVEKIEFKYNKKQTNQ